MFHNSGLEWCGRAAQSHANPSAIVALRCSDRCRMRSDPQTLVVRVGSRQMPHHSDSDLFRYPQTLRMRSNGVNVRSWSEMSDMHQSSIMLTARNVSLRTTCGICIATLLIARSLEHVDRRWSSNRSCRMLRNESQCVVVRHSSDPCRSMCPNATYSHPRVSHDRPEWGMGVGIGFGCKE